MPTILIVEDDENIREILEAFLEEEGYEALVASNGKDGIAIALDRSPDLIICDVMMPGMSGFEVVERLRSHPSTSLVPFIFLSALAEKKDLRLGMNLGADDYLTKPFTRSDLLMAVRSRLERSRLVKEFMNSERQEMRRKLLEEIPDRFGNLLNNLMGCFDLLAEENDPEEKARYHADGRKAIAELYAIWLANLRAMGSGSKF